MTRSEREKSLTRRYVNQSFRMPSGRPHGPGGAVPAACTAREGQVPVARAAGAPECMPEGADSPKTAAP